MDIRNRMADVKALICHACQDYIKYLLPKGWQQSVYQKAESEVEAKTRFMNHYIPAYERMRDIGVDNYRVEDMDVTLISELLHSYRSFIKADNRVVRAIEMIRDDRNSAGHSGEHEDPEELYLRGLLSLCHLREFIRTVDKCEYNISKDDRAEYRKKYMSEIESLMDTLDEERIELVQKIKDINRDIQNILNSEKPEEIWLQLQEIRLKKYAIDNNINSLLDFNVRASDAGISYAHSGAADFFVIKKDFDETERRLNMLFDAFADKPGSEYEMKSIVDTINHCLIKGCPLREGFKELIEKIKNHGYSISQTDDGRYIWNKRKRSK